MKRQFILTIKRRFLMMMILFVGACALTLTTAIETEAATLTVTKTEDTKDGACNADCSLREAITAATNNDEIVFSSFFDQPQTIVLNEEFGELNIKNITLKITGKGANLLTVRRAADAIARFRIFFIEFSTITISGMTISGGYIERLNCCSLNGGGGVYTVGGINTFVNCHFTGNTAADYGGAIFQFGGLVYVNNSTISNNTTLNNTGAGGIYSQQNGVLHVANSTVSGNTKNSGSSYAGGISIEPGMQAEITASTITNNQNANGTGGVFARSSTVTVRNSIIAANSGYSTAPDIETGDSGAFASEGYNLIGNRGAVMAFNQNGDQNGTSAAPLNAQLAILGHYGGTMPTHALRHTSPAIDKGKAFALAADQRGQSRPYDYSTIPAATGGDNSDIGAFEVSPRLLIVTKTEDTNDGSCDEQDCSLREAIAAPGIFDEIEFASPLFDSPQTITLSDAPGFRELVINRSLAIAGKGAQLLTVRRAADATALFRIFRIDAKNAVSLVGMTITGGNVAGEGGGIAAIGSTTNIIGCHITGNTASSRGGGIRNTGNTIDHGTMNIKTSTVSNNVSNDANSGGGGIQNTRGTLTITSSTVSGNVKNNGDNNAGGIWAGGNVTLTHSTVADNETIGGQSASGIYRGNSADDPTNLTLRNTIVATNRNNASLPDVVVFSGASLVSEGFNLIGNAGASSGFFNSTSDQKGNAAVRIDPLLKPLGLAGGTMPTHGFRNSSSPAIDRGKSFNYGTDQRGAARILDFESVANAAGGDGADIGAFEAQILPTFNIAGKIAYGIARNGEPTKYVPDVRLTISEAIFAVTNSSGDYSLNDLETGGNYIVTASKIGDRSGITAFDSALILRCVAAGAGCALSENQTLAANADNSFENGAATITAFDAALILRFVAANGNTNAAGETGKWRFKDSPRNYDSPNQTLAGENYEAILVGEIDGDWTPASSLFSDEKRSNAQSKESASADETTVQ